MRAERCIRTWLVLLLGVTVTALGTASPTAATHAGGAEGVATPWADGWSAYRRADGRAVSKADGLPGADQAVPTVGRAWPVGIRPRVARGWEPPASAYGRGHRGVDLAAPSGTPVRAVAPGRVSFAGRVAGRGVVSVELDGTGDPPVRTTYEPVRATVKTGVKVAAGEVVGVVEPTGSHCTTPCLHWGLRRADVYLDPLSLLPPWLLHRGPSRLLPVIGVSEGAPAQDARGVSDT